MTVPLITSRYLPAWSRPWLRAIKRSVAKRRPAIPSIDIQGERDIEWSFLSREMPNGPGQALDFGCEHGYMSLVAAQKGFDVLALDLEEQQLLWTHPKVTFQRGDLLELYLPTENFDLIVNCSSVEHVGIVGRYGISRERSDGDLEVMRRFAEVLKSTGLLLMTAPCGRDSVMAPWCRVYGEQRLGRLFERLELMNEAYWTKNGENRWTESTRDAALNFQPVYHPTNPHGCAYALGCFVLRKRS